VKAAVDFDHFADSYDRALGEALAASGEDSRYFAEGRVNWLAACLRQIAFVPRRMMDYGCGPGSTSPILLERFGAESVVGVDLSQRSIELARQNHGSDRTQFSRIRDYTPAASLDLVYCNGVFHHIPPPERAASLDFIRRSLRPGGLFCLWENNPWNPGTQYVMSRCAFDRDAIKISPSEARNRLRSAGFQILRMDFLFIFPRFLKALRPAEGILSRLPFGAQYQILCQRPSE
jgi:SAM-dependent methyltransferase